MFDLSNPQKRERVLVIVAIIALCLIVVLVLPGQFTELTVLKAQRDKKQEEIKVLEEHAKNKDEIQSRLLSMQSQAFAFAGTQRNQAVSNYQTWLMGLAGGAGLGNLTLRETRATGVKDIYEKSIFTLDGEGGLPEIAEFLRRFHRTDYLHIMANVSPRPSARTTSSAARGTPARQLFTVTFRIEVLALPQIRTSIVPSADRATFAITEEEQQMLAAITSRAILSEYVQPAPPPVQPAAEVTPEPPRPPDFNHTTYCIVMGITGSNGKPLCWITHQTLDQKYYLFPEESFTLEGTIATVKKIEAKAGRVHFAAAGGVYTVGLGKSFAQAEDPCYFFTGIVDANENPWTVESLGEPRCVIVYGFVDARGNTVERARYLLSAGASFPMAEVTATVRRVDSVRRQIQIEAAGAGVHNWS